MYKINCLNPIAKVGTKLLTDNYTMTDNFAEADAALVRSASVHELELPDSLEAIARAGAGVNNIPLDKCAQKEMCIRDRFATSPKETVARHRLSSAIM